MSEKHPTTEESLKRTSERIIDATSRTLHHATFKANQYKSIVQKRIDLGSLHRRMNHLHHDLGMTLDNLMHNETENVLEHPEIQGMISQLAQMRDQMSRLEMDIEGLRHAEMPEDKPGDIEGPVPH